MTMSMQQLIDEELLVISPVEGRFDTAAVAKRILATGFSFRDEFEPTRFVISSDAASRDAFQKRRREDVAAGFPRTLMLDVREHEILVWPVNGYPPLRALSVEILAWLTNTFSCRVVSDDGKVLPARISADDRDGREGGS